MNMINYWYIKYKNSKRMRKIIMILTITVTILTIIRNIKSNSYNNGNISYNDKKNIQNDENMNDNKYIKLVLQGDIEIEKGNYKKAIEYYEKAKKYNKEAEYHIAGVYYQYINKEEGIERFKKSYENGIVQAAHILGLIAYDKGDFNLAKEWYKKGVDKGEKFSIINLGEILKGENKIEEAKKYFEKVIDGDNAKGIYYLMTIYYKEGNKNKIIELKNKIFEKNLVNIDDEMLLKIDLMLGNEKENKIFELIDAGDSLIIMKKYEEAKIKYKEATKYGFEGYNFLGKLSEQLENTKEALEYYVIAAKEGEIGVSAYNLGVMFENMKNIDSAKKSYERGIELGNSRSLSSLGRIEFLDGNKEKAKELLEKGMEQKNAEAILEMISYYHQKNDNEKIVKLAKQLLEEKGLIYNTHYIKGVATQVLFGGK